MKRSNFRRYFILLLLLVLIFQLSCSKSMPSRVLPSSDEVQAYQLGNGMKVLVVESRRAPVVVSQVWYKVGGSYEHDGITGVSHVLEHMMFKGTPKHPDGEFSDIIAANGGKENAFTGKDFTAYFQRIASDRLELCLQLEADRMVNLVLDEDEFIKEVEVVKEERRLRTDDKPSALTYERFNAVAYTNNPYRQPIIGWMEDLDSMTIEDLRDWYRTWYVPNNATLVVVGDVDAEQVYRLAQKHFGPLASSETPVIKPRREVEQFGTQRLTVKLPAQIPTLVMGYKVPVFSTAEDLEEVYALEVLSGLLDGGNSARLTKNLVRGEELATSISAGYDLYAMYDSLFTFSGTPAGDNSTQELELAIIKEINNIQTKPPEQSELDRVIAQVVAAEVYELDSSFYRAMKIGMLETRNQGWRTQEEYVKRIKAVTAEQVQQVAIKYLVDKHLTVAILEPQQIDEISTTGKSSQKPVSGGRHAH